MTDEELAAYAPRPLPPSMGYLRDLIVRHRQGCPQEVALDMHTEVVRLRAENAALLAEVERRRAQGADYREIVEIVAANKGSVYGLGCHCVMDHREGCPVLVARALLASEG